MSVATLLLKVNKNNLLNNYRGARQEKWGNRGEWGHPFLLFLENRQISYNVLMPSLTTCWVMDSVSSYVGWLESNFKSEATT